MTDYNTTATGTSNWRTFYDPPITATNGIVSSELHYTLANLSTEKASKGRRNVRRKALIVGINKYENPANWLNGCVPDALDMAETLKILKFPPKNIHILLDEQASTKGILEGLNWLTKDAQPGDVLIFYYSGHGSNVVDLNNDEEDSYDEIICPWDIDFRNSKYITDDTLYQYFSEKVPEGTRTDVILDSCFSGSATRSIVAMSNSNNSLISKTKQRYLPPPPEHVFRLNSMIPQFTNVKKFGKSVVTTVKEMEKVSQHNCLLTGSQENDVSYEDVDESGGIRGVMTARFTRILRRSNGNITRREVYSILRSTISNDGFPQVPNLEVPNEEALDLFFFRKESEIDRPSELKK